MDPDLTKFPILSYILSQQDPYTYSSLPPQTHHNLFTHFPHLTDPRIFSSLSQSIPAIVTQTHFLLRSLGPRPEPSTVSLARSKITQIQETQSSSEEAGIYKAVLRLEEMHEDYDRQLTEVEENLGRVYRSVKAEMATLGGRIRNVLIVAADKDHSIESVNFLQNALKSLLDRSNSSDRSKRRRVLDHKIIVQ